MSDISLSIPAPFSGGSISNEKAVLFSAFIKSITLMFYTIFVCIVYNGDKFRKKNGHNGIDIPIFYK